MPSLISYCSLGSNLLTPPQAVARNSCKAPPPSFPSLKFARRKCVQHWCNEKGDITCEICHQHEIGFTFCVGDLKMSVWYKGMRGSHKLEVWKMGFVNYLDALKLQEKLVSDRKLCRIPDTLLSLQHPPTYTLGKRRTDHNLLIPMSELKNIGAELHYTQRGGDITFHGPHQAILYPIISLREIGIGARNYVEKLESTMIELSSLYGVTACAGQKGETGVWVGERKIGAIGVRISNGITSHGLAFNIDPDLKYFKHMVPCGITDKEVTSLRRETSTVLPAEEAIQEQLISCFARLFGYSTVTWKENPVILTDHEGVE